MFSEDFFRYMTSRLPKISDHELVFSRSPKITQRISDENLKLKSQVAGKASLAITQLAKTLLHEYKT